MKRHVIGWKKAAALLWAGLVAAQAQEPFDVRLENFAVMPSTGPVVNAWVRNRTGQALEPVVVRAHWPEGWKVQPPGPFALAPGATAKAAFTVEQAMDSQKNAYPVKLEVAAGGKTVCSSQPVLVATAPYLKPVIDGQVDDWKDAVPVEFATAGKSTSVMTCWNRELFCLAVCVEEDGLGASTDGTRRDGIQFALTPRRSSGPLAVPGKSPRHEFVVLGEKEGKARAFRLLQPQDDLTRAGEARSLEPLLCPDIQATVARSGSVSRYEVAVPLKGMPELRATPGRTFGFSVLVHDAGGTGLRDLGSVMRLWPDQRQATSWCRWAGDCFGAELPFDSDVEFGFSSSIH